jgi:hypothetical protein
VLLPVDALRGIAAGEITVAFRRWKRPTVRAGGTLTTRVGVLAIDAVEPVDDVDEEGARRAGFPDAAAARARLRPEGTLYRVTFHLAGPDPRIALRERAELAPDELAELRARLARLDRSNPRGPWTDATLRAIAAAPGVRAADLAADAGVERLRWKADVRKLKALGLTESLEVGYRLSPRGAAYLSAQE